MAWANKDKHKAGKLAASNHHTALDVIKGNTALKHNKRIQIPHAVCELSTEGSDLELAMPKVNSIL